MEPIYIFPGSFCPPTYGHFEIVRQAAEILPELIIVCSRNPTKVNDWFTEDECVQMWLDAYMLPENVSVTTFSEIGKRDLDLSGVVLVRGIRDDRDLIGESRVIEDNLRKLGINKYLYIVAGDQFHKISSTRARELALQGEIDRMKRFVPSIIATTMCVRFQEDEVDYPEELSFVIPVSNQQVKRRMIERGMGDFIYVPGED